MRRTIPIALLTLALTLAAAAPAQQPARSAPAAVPLATNIPDPADTPWPGGAMALDIDATDIARGIYRAVQTIPLAPGTDRVTLLFPQWLPGNHGPRGPLAELADISFSADGKPATWRRDPVEVNAFHVDLPAGTRTLVGRFVHTSPLQGSEGRITMTPDMLNLQWEKMSLYPAGHYVRRIRVRPSVTLPVGWTGATALDGQSLSGNRLSWAETDYETLVDSPIFAGQNYRRWDLGQGVTLHAVADAPDQLDLAPENQQRLSALVRETVALFGARHFDHYEYLVALSDRLGGIGLEHHRSSENQLEPNAFTDWRGFDWDRNVLAHELVHSWNGKFRRPARLWTPDYRQPMQDDLLWLYEGQTQFWGHVLAARSGLQSKAMVLGMIAAQAGKYSEQPGRAWRSVGDTTFDPVFAARKPRPYASLARDEDYYNEGMLVWLEADQVIRAGTGGRKGLDDFARAFFGMKDGDWGVLTYELPDVIATLDSVYKQDWAAFFRSRIDSPGQPAPTRGIELGGYKLVWKAEPNPYDRALMDDQRNLNLFYSLGLVIDRDGQVTATRWGGPAFAAGIVNGTRIVAVNSVAYDQDRLKQAVTAATASKPVELLVRRGDRYRTVAVSWSGGLRWPWIERADGGKGPAAPLDLLLAPRAIATAK